MKLNLNETDMTHYLRKRVGDGDVITYQVKASGVRYLAKRSIQAGGEIPWYEFNHLRDAGMLTTKGSNKTKPRTKTTSRLVSTPSNGGTRH